MINTVTPAKTAQIPTSAKVPEMNRPRRSAMIRIISAQKPSTAHGIQDAMLRTL